MWILDGWQVLPNKANPGMSECSAVVACIVRDTEAGSRYLNRQRFFRTVFW
jgi:hypothetical protein